MKAAARVTQEAAPYACKRCGAGRFCKCNAPAVERVAEYDEANPGRSTRRAAADIGVSRQTVSKARRTGVNKLTPVVIGRDGKKYKTGRDAKPKLRLVPNDGDETAEETWQRMAGNLAGSAVAMQALWTRMFGKQWKEFSAPQSLVTLADDAAAAWKDLASDLKNRRKGNAA